MPVSFPTARKPLDPSQRPRLIVNFFYYPLNPIVKKKKNAPTSSPLFRKFVKMKFLRISPFIVPPPQTIKRRKNKKPHVKKKLKLKVGSPFKKKREVKIVKLEGMPLLV